MGSSVPIMSNVTKAETQTPERIALRRNEFAAALGVSAKTVSRWVDRGDVRSIRIGRALFIPAAEVERLRGRPA
jgi:excisionase family DNA binding protein